MSTTNYGELLPESKIVEIIKKDLNTTENVEVLKVDLKSGTEAGRF